MYRRKHESFQTKKLEGTRGDVKRLKEKSA